jgi:uncharacterized protein YigE (DUF2233 family)
MKILVLFFVFFLVIGGTAFCLDLKPAKEGGKYTVIRVNMDKDWLALFLRDDEGKLFGNFDAVQAWLKARDQKLLFAMNAGMFHADYTAVGLFVREGTMIHPLNLDNGEGNFFLKPNGVFYVNESGAGVVEASRYSLVTGNVSLATQSGPMLVIDGKIHPAFRADSTSRLVRNGVGIVSSKEVVFVISEKPVNFYEFAAYFRDDLHCGNALFLDGTVSSLYSPELKRNDKKIDLGPIIGVVSGQ